MLDWFSQQTPYRQWGLNLSALVAGVLLPFAFAPYEYFWLVFPLLSWLFLISINQTPGTAFKRGMFFGIGWFAHGLYWLYYSLHVYGNAPVPLVVVILFGLACVMALFPAMALYINRRFFKLSVEQQCVLVLPLSWLLSEWLRGYVLTGFPWLEVGYTQVDTQLSAYVPVIGNLGLSWVLAFISGLLVLILLKRRVFLHLGLLLLIIILAIVLGQVSWTTKIDQPIVVSLIQGNIPQKDKWKPQLRKSTIDMYTSLSLQQAESDLIIWPETAVPGYQHRVENYLKNFNQQIQQREQDLLYGIFVRDFQTKHYYNSVVSVRGGVYKKRHLVPLGEYFPFQGLMGFLRQWIDIPMSDIAEGDNEQALIQVAGQPVGISICFEDAFDRNVLSTLPEASLLINVSNDAWFEDSIQPPQHHQIARMRALETGRYLLRATNTGLSAIIQPNGQVVAIAPAFERHVLTARVYPMSGSTPYVLWKNYLSISLALLILFGLWWKNRHGAIGSDS